jgi:predicted nucleic acid-binding protein
MQRVVSNSTPIIHLAKTGQLGLLEHFFDTVLIPQAVQTETISQGAQRPEVDTIRNADLLELRPISSTLLSRTLQMEIDAGEAEAIVLALESGIDLLLMDDSEGRQKARMLGLKTVGTLGLLLRAYQKGIIPSLDEAIAQLEQSGFWLDKNLKARILSVKP